MDHHPSQGRDADVPGHAAHEEDALILYVSAAAIALIVGAERVFMRSHTVVDGHMEM